MSRRTPIAALLLGLLAASAQAAPTKVSFDLLRTVQSVHLGSGPLALGADGQRLAVLDFNSTDTRKSSLVVREAQTGRELWRVPAPDSYGERLVFSPDGQTLLHLGQAARAYDAATGKPRWARTESKTSYTGAIFSSDSSAVYLSSLENWATPHLTRVESTSGAANWQGIALSASSQDERPMEGFYSRVTALTLNPAGDLLATGSFGGGLVLRRPDSNGATTILTDPPISGRPTQAALAGKTAHGGQVLGLVFAPDGSLISGANDGTVKRWEVASGRRLALALLPGGVQAMTLLPDAQGLLVTSSTEVVQLRLPDLQEVRRFSGHVGQITSLAASGNTVWTSSQDGTIKRWNLHSGQEEATFGRVKVAAVSPDGQTFALNLGDSTVRLTDAKGNTLRTLRGFVSPSKKAWEYIGARSLAFSPDGKTLAGGVVSKFRMTMESYTSGTTGYLWDVKTGQAPRALPGLPGEAVTFSPDGQQLLGVSTQDGSVPGYQVRRVSDGAVLAKPCAPFTPDLSQLVGPSCPVERVRGASWVGQRVRVLTMPGDAGRPATSIKDAVTGKVLTPLGKLWQNGPAMGVSPDGTRVVSLARNGLRVWGGGGRLLRTWPDILDALPYNNGPLWFSPDGQWFTYPDQTLNPPKLHSALTGEVLGTLNQKTSALGFVQRGQVLVTLSPDRGVQLWRIRAAK